MGATTAGIGATSAERAAPTSGASGDSGSVVVDDGATVALTLADGSSRAYEVVERQQYGKLMLPADRIWTRAGPETLVLITCGGSFNPQIHHYRDNIVIYAVPIAE